MCVCLNTQHVIRNRRERHMQLAPSDSKPNYVFISEITRDNAFLATNIEVIHLTVMPYDNTDCPQMFRLAYDANVW